MLSNSDIAVYFRTNNVRQPQRLQNMELLPEYAQKLVTFYASQSYVKAVMTIGSLSSGTSDERSDLDLVIVCSNEGVPPKEQRLGVIGHISNNTATFNSVDLKIWNFGTSDDFIINGQEICTQFFTVAYLQEKIDHIVNGFYSQVGMEHPLASLSGLLKATVHIDKEGTYKKLKKKVEPYPVQLQKIILDNELGMRFPYYLDRLETAISRGDIPFADKMIHQAIDAAVYILFALHRRYPNGPKRLFKQIDEMVAEPTASQVKEYLLALYKDKTTPETLRHKATILRNLFTVLQNYNQAYIS